MRFIQTVLFGPAVALLVCLNSVSGALAVEYYVAPGGLDSNPGTLASPWKTISKAAQSIIAGDTVYVAGGTYSERVIPVHSGAAGKYITFKAQPDAEVILDGSSITLPEYDSGLIHIENKAFIVVSGFHVRNAGPHMNNAGIFIDASNNIILEKNRTYNTVSSGIGVWSSEDVTINGNEVELACNDGEQECISIAGTDGFTVSNNHVHHNGPGTNGGEGIDAKDGSSNGRIFGNVIHDLTRLGLYVDAWDKHTHSIEIYSNRIYNCANDGIVLASEQGGLLEDIHVVNNLVTGNRYNGISITPNGDVNEPPMRNLFIINNTLYNNGDDSVANPWGGGISVDNPNIDTLVIRNNIFSRNLLFQILLDYPVSGLSVDHNLLDGFSGFENEIKGSTFVEGSPGFINAGQGDFHLGANSSAIDRGSSLHAPENDFDMVERPQGTGIDIGAYEHRFLTGKPIPGILMLLMH